MENNGDILRKIGLQLQNMSSQMQNMGIQISNFNQFFGLQIQNMSAQISNMAMQIFNIGMQILNLNQMQNNFGIQMNNMNNEFQEINRINPMKNLELINDINNFDNQFKEPIINICFRNDVGQKEFIVVKMKDTVKELLNLYRIKIGENSDFFLKNYFSFNGRKINPNEEKKVIDYGLNDWSEIIVIKSNNVIGVP